MVGGGRFVLRTGETQVKTGVAVQNIWRGLLPEAWPHLSRGDALTWFVEGAAESPFPIYVCSYYVLSRHTGQQGNMRA